MVRRVELRLIEDELSRQLSFAKRRNGLIKKALELYMVCGIDCVFISFSTSGRLSYFSGDKRIEDVLARFAALPTEIRRYYIPDHEWQELVHILGELREQTDDHLQTDGNIQALLQENSRLQEEIHRLQVDLRRYEPVVEPTMTITEANITERFLEETLARVQERKRQLTGQHVNDASQPSDSAVGAGSSSTNHVEDVHQPQSELPPNQDSDKTETQIFDQAVLALPSDGQSTLVETSPPRSLLVELASPRPHQSGTFSSLLLDEDISEMISPVREIVPESPAVSFVQSPQGQPLEQNNNGSIQQQPFSVFHDGVLNTQFYSWGNRTAVDNQSSDYIQNAYETPGYDIPAANFPPPDFFYTNSPASLQGPLQNMQFQTQSSAVYPEAPLMQHPNYYPASLGGNATVPPFVNHPWVNQNALQSNQTFLGPRVGLQNLLNSVPRNDNMELQATRLSAFEILSNQQLNHQSMGGHSIRSSLPLNQRGPLTNPSEGVWQGPQTPAALGQFELGSSSSSSHKRKNPWEDEEVLRFVNNQNGNATANSVHSFAPRPSSNLLYDSAFQAVGLHVDPYMRVYQGMYNNGGNRRGPLAEHQQ